MAHHLGNILETRPSETKNSHKIVLFFCGMNGFLKNAMDQSTCMVTLCVIQNMHIKPDPVHILDFSASWNSLT